MKKILALTFILVFAPYANAADSAPEKEFANWNEAADELTGLGIDVTRLPWQEIDPMCRANLRKGGQKLFTKCRYEKALNFKYFQAAKEDCNISANREFPDSLLDNRKTETIDVVNSDATISKIDKTATGITKAELQNKRDKNYIDCMKAEGWISANDWKLGKK